MRNKYEGIGGALTIPHNYAVIKVDLDCEEPYCNIIECDKLTTEEIKLSIPKSLAYYLRTHFCGSDKMRNQTLEMGRHEIRESIKKTLGIVE